ncbi:MAG: hypothetical protein ACI4F7_03270 [Acutalibacteraceae bacterium]
MKKILAFVLVAVLAFSAVTANAAPSPEKLEGVISSATASDSKGTAVKVVLSDATSDRSAYNTALEELKAANGSDLKVVDHKVIALDGTGSPTYPLTVELKIPGVKASSKGFVLFKNSQGTVEKLTATMGDGKVTVTFNELGEFVFVTDSQTVTDINSAGANKSPQTSDTATPIAVLLLAASAAVAIVSVKKIRTAA